MEEFDSMWWILQRICFKAEEGETMAASTIASVVPTKVPVVTMMQWARIHAKAWLEGTWGPAPDFKWLPGEFQQLVETDLHRALDLVRKDFGIRDEAKHFDIDDPTYSGGTDESGAEPKFNVLNQAQLETVIIDGKLPDGRTAKMVPSEWVSYPPLFTKSLEAPNDGATLSLLEWARILAYLHRFKKLKDPRVSDPTDPRFMALKYHYETNPAEAVAAIVHGGRAKGEKEAFEIGGLEGEFKDAPAIKYIHKETALFRLGDPPKAARVNLQEVLDNPNGYARVMVRICC